MKFTHAPGPDPRGQYTERWLSETGTWELGFWPTIYGCRVRAGRTDDYCCVPIDYCCGDDAVLLMEVLMVVAKLMEPLPDSATNADVERIFPRHTTKPIHLDPIWPQLQGRAGMVAC